MSSEIQNHPVTETGASSIINNNNNPLQSRRALYVGGLADDVTEHNLRAAMIPFGPIKSIDIPKDYSKGVHKGFGFVEFEDADDAAEAIFNMDGAELFGKALNVNLAQQNEHRLGSNKPIWSSDEWFKEQAKDGGGGGSTKEMAEETKATETEELKARPLVSGATR